MRALSPRSELRDIVWPGLPPEPGARLLAMQFQYAESERWAPEEIQAQQFRQLETLIAHCDRAIPFYRERLRRAGLRAGQNLTKQLWSRLPVLTRVEAEAAGKRLHSGKIPQSHGGVVTSAVSGPAGSKLDFCRSELAHFFWLSHELRGALWHDALFAEKLAVIEAETLIPPPAGGLRVADWGPSFAAAFTTGQAARLDIGQKLAAQAAWLVAEQPAYLRTTAANAALLAQHFLGHSLRLPDLRAIYTTGKTLSPDQRALCEAAFGVNGIDAYSAEEMGIIALRCPLHAHHHVASEGVLLEVLDERGKACAPGEVGRVVVTPLHNFATPLLRYAPGDYARSGPPCSCGRTLPVLTQIAGRAEDLARLPDATFHPAPCEARQPNGTPARIPRSGVSDLRWPAVPMGEAARMLALQYQLSRTERWAGEELVAHQFAQLDQLVAHCDRTMPFYRQRLRQAGITPGQQFTPESWARIPVLTRAEAQEAGTALHCRSVPAAHGALSRASTSGSTGMPLSVIKTDLHQRFWDSFLLREVLWHRLDLKGKWAIIRSDRSGSAGSEKGQRSPDLGPPISKVFTTGPSVFFEIRRPIVEQAAWLVREDPDYLLTFASNLALLAQHFRDTGQRPKRLRALRSFAEVVSPDLRDLCREVFGVDIITSYSAEETGYLALQCPDGAGEHGHLHVASEGVKLEVLDDNGEACPPGGIGQVVATPLHNFAMPLLRYALGDYAEVGPPCRCGSGLPVLTRILGRIRHRVIMPSGEARAALFGSKSFYKIAAIRQFQAAQTSRDTIEMRLVAQRKLTKEEEGQVTQFIRDDLDPSFKVRLVYVDEIPRLAGGKYEEFRCEIA